MKKLLAMLLVLVMIMSVACSKGDNKDNTPTSTPEPTVTATPEPTKEPTAVPTEAPTEAPTEEPTPEPTEEPTPTEEPGDGTIDAGTLYSDNYEDFTGTWYLNRGEVEGEEWTPDDVEEYLFINFLSDLTAERVRELTDAPEEVQHGVVTYGRNDDGKAWVSVDYKDEDCNYSYILNDEGELEEHIDYEYIDGTNVTASLWYCRTPFWGGEGDPQVWKDIPAEIQTLIDNAADNAWLITIADPSEELSNACNEAGWEISDETNNEWVNCPWNNPKELIIVNSSDREVEIEIHEPKSDYDPSSEESGWQAGPFMYCAYLKPGELYRCIVDMPDEKKDATMCLYMKFEGDEFDYFLRIFKYDSEDPYVIF